ncbi:hypothetical protein JQ581_35460 [Bradyrhizobium liaoningense]|uniref:hypothetical protein n=1 Tax=Bradyrhizobium liaoningense TaxID=43992 RepID=UPI001BADE4D9|nr:hypothetical protein [Bradyrhizobium liaoningense]MBR0742250.1 hypothetical protein [Bradyrhizobium liaoningense]
MRYLTPSLFLFLASALQAEAAPTSIRCEGRYYQQQQPYFVTYDLESAHFVFENPGGNILPGEIIRASDAQLDLSLRADGGRILLSFNRTRNMMTWPGMPAQEMGRETLQHVCRVVAGRTMLSAFRQPEQFDLKRLDPVDAFSLTCPGQYGPYFVTLDRSTKTVVLETQSAAETMSGNITGANDGSINFAVAGHSGRHFDLVWDNSKRSLTWTGVADDPTRPTISHECAVTEPRSIMETYAVLARWRRM